MDSHMDCKALFGINSWSQRIMTKQNELFGDGINNLNLTANTPLLMSQKIESWCSRQIPVQEVPMRSTDAIYDFR